MAKKKQKTQKPTTSDEKQLEALVKKLRGQLAAAEKSAEKWKARAKDRRSVAAGAKAELAGVRRRAEKAEAAVAKWKDRAKKQAPAAVPATGPAPTRVSTTPDETWNVTRLRAEARRRGVAGYSRKSKEQLLVDLRG